MARIWNKFIPLDKKVSRGTSKQFHPVRDSEHYNGAGTPLKPHTSSLRSGRKVFVAMSGGVDSSVAALLLKSQGYDVTGVYMKNWSEESFGGQFAAFCPWREDLKDVRAVCKKLGIPLKVYNFEKEYGKKVIDYFFCGEKAGKTPNPDVICNREIKFGLFLRRAIADGADFVATGHYAKKISIPEGFALKIAKDKNKDQTYFLCLLNQRQLARALFPLGGYTKPEVRELARKAGLPTAEKPESMGICFVGEIKMDDFLRARIRQHPGDIVSVEGKILGRHKGLPFYTIGQRKGLRIPGLKPWFVVDKKIKTNRLVVAAGSKNHSLFKKTVGLEKWHWLAAKTEKTRFRCLARIRHRQPLQAAVFYPGRYPKIAFIRPQRAVTPGQFCTIYRNGVLLGGGAIKA